MRLVFNRRNFGIEICGLKSGVLNPANFYKIRLDIDAEQDIIKQGHLHDWDKEFIVNCLRNGKTYSGAELYPVEKNRHRRYYCIHKPYLLSSNLILIGFLILKDILIIHISPLNRGSKEGRIYYSS